MDRSLMARYPWVCPGAGLFAVPLYLRKGPDMTSSMWRGPRAVIGAIALAAVTQAASGQNERRFTERLISIYRLCFACPSVEAIYWMGCPAWDFAQRGDGLLRANLAPTPAQKILARQLHSNWHSRASGFSDFRGRFSFRGFIGRYRIVKR